MNYQTYTILCFILLILLSKLIYALLFHCSIFLSIDSKMDENARQKFSGGPPSEETEKPEAENMHTNLTVVLEYFFSPNRKYTPHCFVRNQYNTVAIEAVKFQTALYSPNCWFDSAVPFGFSDGATNFMLDKMYMKSVRVNTVPACKKVFPAVEETILWTFVSRIIKEEEGFPPGLYGNTILWPFVSGITKKEEGFPPGSCENTILWPSVSGITNEEEGFPPGSYGNFICSSFPRQNKLSDLAKTLGSAIYDEAPLFRILLLLDSLQSPQCHDRYDYTVQNLFLQSYGFTSSVSWLQEINDTNKGSQAPGLHSSVIQCVSLSYYLKEHSWPYKVVIPVVRSWSRSSWLFPYIAAFTTTAWWNFGLVLRTEILNSTTGKPYGEHSILSFPEASTVYVPGSFESILLVLIDVKSDHHVHDFFVGTLKIPVTKENSDHSVNFSLPFYTYLGRCGAVSYPFDISINKEIVKDVQVAMKYIVDTVCMPGILQRCIAMVSETCRMRYHNNWVVPSPDPLVDKTDASNSSLVHSLNQLNVLADLSDEELETVVKKMSEVTADISQAVNSKLMRTVGCASEMQTMSEAHSEQISEPEILKFETVSDNAQNSVACDSQTLTHRTEAFKSFVQHGRTAIINALKEEELEKKRKSQICRYFTPMMNLTGTQQKIGDKDLPLVSILSDEHLANLKIAAFSRVSPMHVIPSSSVHILNEGAKDNENVLMPCFHESESEMIQYDITEASSAARIIIASSRRGNHSEVERIRADALTLEITSFASIIGAVAEWTFAHFGINFLDMNELTEVDISGEQYNFWQSFWPSLTHNFISRPWQGSRCFVTEIGPSILRRIGIKNLEIDKFHGGLLPWWYVYAVAMKFICGPLAFPRPEIMDIPEPGFDPRDLGFRITSKDPWYTLPFYGSNNQYDHPVFQNYYMFYHGHCEPVAWYPDAYVDATRLAQSLRLKSPAPEQPKYFCEILTTPFETGRDFIYHCNSICVSHSCPSYLTKENFIPVLNDLFFLNIELPPEIFVKNSELKHS